MEKEFEKICRMSQKTLKKYVVTQLKENYTNVINGDGFVYAEGEFPVLLVAHLDTVHDNLPNIILNDNGVLSSPNGIGGDDRCGVYMILEIVKRYNCSVLFCKDEEIGCVGAKKFVETKLADSLVGKFNYIMEFDRKGKNDAVFYDCDNKEFEAFITREFYKTDIGSFSDISVIAPFLECAAVNLSCGYYNAHNKKEYVVWKEMNVSIDEAKKILARTTAEDKFEYVEALGYGNYGWYDDPYFDEDYYVVEFIDEHDEYTYFEAMALSEEEAIGLWCIANDKLPFSSVVNVYKEKVTPYGTMDWR